MDSPAYFPRCVLSPTGGSLPTGFPRGPVDQGFVPVVTPKRGCTTVPFIGGSLKVVVEACTLCVQVVSIPAVLVRVQVEAPVAPGRRGDFPASLPSSEEVVDKSFCSRYIASGSSWELQPPRRRGGFWEHKRATRRLTG